MESMLNRWLWRHEYWLPPGVTWSDMVETESVQYPQPRDLLLTLPLSLVFIAARYAFERLVALPLSRKLGVRDTTRRVLAVQNVTLEVFYKQQTRSPSQNQFHSLSKQCDLSQRQIERWFRLRRNQDRPSNSKKFCEACWRFTFYMIAFLAGLAVLVDDFKEQVVHHIATIFLMGFSYCANYIRVGTLVLLVHDASDYLLESAKMFNYAGWRRVCDSLFFIFTAVFLVTRLVVFPSKVLYTTWYLSMESFQPFFGYYFFNALLLVLQLLHVFWAFLILRMVWKFVVQGRVSTGSTHQGAVPYLAWRQPLGTGGLWVVESLCIYFLSPSCAALPDFRQGRVSARFCPA
ncbi:UNVERIFIED_CONTAM: hypothetical protein FKN15_069046 [Acipenser sinensis]